jgi:hypothetical protein
MIRKVLLILFFIFFNVSPVFAQGQPTGMQTGKAQINLGNKQPAGMGIKVVGNPNASVGTIVSNVVLIMFIIGGMAVLVFFIWGAFDWITSGGDKEKIAKARAKIFNAFIGLALLALAAFIVSLFGQIVGFNPLKTPPLPKLDDAPAPFPS